MTQCLSHNGHAPYTQRIGSGDETRIHVLDEHTGERNSSRRTVMPFMAWITSIMAYVENQGNLHHRQGFKDAPQTLYRPVKSRRCDPIPMDRLMSSCSKCTCLCSRNRADPPALLMYRGLEYIILFVACTCTRAGVK